MNLVYSYIRSSPPDILKWKNSPLNVNWQPCSHGVVSSNKLSRFFGSKLGRDKASSVRMQLWPRRCEPLVDDECLLCMDFSFLMSVWCLACMGLALGVSVWQEPFEWILEGVCGKLQKDQSFRFERVGVLAGLRWLCVGEPGRGVDVLSIDSLDLTLWRTCQKI